MSAVELPQVPSARSSSASSSGRRTLSSAGSDKSFKSQQQNPRRSYRDFESENDEDDEQNGQDDDDYDDHEAGLEQEEPQETGSGLWDEVETFLNKPSPSLAALAKNGKTKTTTNRLPTIKSDPQKRENQTPSMRPTRPVRSVYAASSSGAGSKSAKAIDPKLLQEAFAYAQRVQSMDFDDDQQEEVAARSQFARHASSSSSSSSSSLANGVRANSSKKIAVGTSKASSEEPRKKPSSSKQPSAYSSSVKPQRKKSEKRVKEPTTQWDTSNSGSRMGDGSSVGTGGGGSTSEAPSRKTMDPQTVQSLVSNFQNGTTLEELRRELAASQQSMQMSRQIIQDAAQSFFQPAR